jgi:hypothetical protein
MATSKKANNMTIKILKSPITLLAKARDMYVKSMIHCSGRVNIKSMGLPSDTLPKSFSVNSTRSLANDEEFKELIRSLALARKIDNELLNKEQMPTKISRSRTVAHGKIDEEGEECEFLMNDNVKSTIDFYPRSKSVAVGSKRATFVF